MSGAWLSAGENGSVPEVGPELRRGAEAAERLTLSPVLAGAPGSCPPRPSDCNTLCMLRSLRLTLAVVYPLLLGCSSSPLAPSAPGAIVDDHDSGTSPSQTAVSIAQLTNAERAAAGIPALQIDSALMLAAQLHADQMAQARQMAHTLPGAPYPAMTDRLVAAGYEWAAAGENIASGYPSPAQAMSGWMQSSGHRANILNASFTEIGAGYAVDTAGQPYYVQVFGRPR